jgi:hypothetical protein
MTYFIGALCLWHAPFAAGLSVILTIILMLKHPIHGFASQWITEREFRDGLFLLALLHPCVKCLIGIQGREVAAKGNINRVGVHRAFLWAKKSPRGAGRGE